MTWVTCSMSSPRAAMSVATRSFTRWSLKAIITPSREPWLMSPWSALTSRPRSLRVFSSREAPIFVRQKMIACSGSSAFSSSTSRSAFSRCGTSTKACWIASTVSFFGVIRIVVGSYM